MKILSEYGEPESVLEERSKKPKTKCQKPLRNSENRREKAHNHRETGKTIAEWHPTGAKREKPLRNEKNRCGMQHYHVELHSAPENCIPQRLNQ